MFFIQMNNNMIYVIAMYKKIKKIDKMLILLYDNEMEKW